MSAVRGTLSECLDDVGTFSRYVVRRPLRPYQLAPAGAIVDSALNGRGLTFAVMMSRQAGKNELSAQVEAYLLNCFQRRGGQIVKASPTYKPQTVNSILRLLACCHNFLNAGRVRRREGYMVQLGRARALFFSADPAANVVGATADVLLEGDEAQDILEAKWFKDFAPMAASTGATTVLYGTAWTSDTLLARSVAHLRSLEAADGQRRVYRYDAEEVGACLPAYARYVGQQVARLGRDHPLIKSQYYLEAIDGAGGFFPPARRALMRGEHQRCHEPAAGRRYALLVDVGGGEETPGDALSRAMLENPRRDATAVTIVEADLAPGRLPHYRTVDRRLWLGTKHTVLYERILALVEHWRAAWVVVDATGIGEGLSAFLSRALGERVIPVVFSTKSKSALGWKFVGAVETGRYREYADDGEPDTRQFWYEVEQCQYEVVPGPGERVRWGVWKPPGYDGLVARGHDDLLVSAALCVVLDEREWATTGTAGVALRPDPLGEIDGGEW